MMNLYVYIIDCSFYQIFEIQKSFKVRLKKYRYFEMFSDSDEGRDSTLDTRYGLDFGDSKKETTPANVPNITPDSRFDQSFSFSDSDNGSFVETKPKGKSNNVQAPSQSTPIVSDTKYQSNSNAAKASNLASSPRQNQYDENYSLDNDDMPDTSELASIFNLITNFQPEIVDLSVHWKPFVPDLVPAIGAIDAFIKVPRPDGEMDDLGLVILDEPSISQSNPQVLKMELREQYGVTSPGNEGDGYIGFIEDAPKNRKALDSFLASIEEIHRNRPPPVLIYTSQMPEMEDLMEPWDDKFEDTLKSCLLPTAELDISLEEYARIICALLGIPVKGNIIESLHHLFSLYAEFEANHYFQSQEQA